MQLVRENITPNIISSGLVMIQEHKILLCHPTNSSWIGTFSFPKGHVEEGESILDAAIRETKEEVGLTIDIDDINTHKYGEIFYKNKDKDTFKKVIYFVVHPSKKIEIETIKLQLQEVDYANFFTKEEAERRIFWRLKEVLDFM